MLLNYRNFNSKDSLLFKYNNLRFIKYKSAVKMGAVSTSKFCDSLFTKKHNQNSL